MDDETLQHVATALPRLFGSLPGAELRGIASRFEPTHLASGEVLYRQGDVGDCLHIVVTGRLLISVAGPSGAERIVGHATGGDAVGEVALLTGRPRAATVVAARDSVLVRLDRGRFEEVVRTHPEAGLNVARFGIGRLTGSGPGSEGPKVRSIALVGLDPDFPLESFGRRLELALLRLGTTLYLDGPTVGHRRGRRSATGADSSGLDLDRLLDDVERRHRFVLLEADARDAEWTRKCIRHADRVLVVARDSASPELRPLERDLLGGRGGHGGPAPADTDLVLLHPGERATPSRTAEWLAPRRVGRHHHVAWEGRRSLNRLARILAGQAVTLVFGGGGARGFAQLGAVRALREAGVPIDAVGGTSIGAIIGALVALDWDDERILQSCKWAFVDEKPLNDYTLPLFALVRGDKLSRGLRRYFGDIDIVDLWAPFFCVTSNLSQSCAAVHRSGTLWKALRATVSLPGILPPFVLDGALHVDGGILDNLPVEEMRSSLGGRVVSVDTSVRREYRTARDVFPSPLGFLWDRFVRRETGPSTPLLTSVIIKAVTLGGSSSAADAEARSDLYLNPPMAGFDFLDWSRIYEIVELGYRYTQERLVPWLEENPGVVRRDEMLEFRAPGRAPRHTHTLDRPA